MDFLGLIHSNRQTLTRADAVEHLDATIGYLRSVSALNQTPAEANADRLHQATAHRNLAALALRQNGYTKLAARLEATTLPAPSPLGWLRPARGLEWASAKVAIRTLESLRHAAAEPTTPVPAATHNTVEQFHRLTPWLMLPLVAVLLLRFAYFGMQVFFGL